jgi:uncharacterized protein (DUF1501 family)
MEKRMNTRRRFLQGLGTAALLQVCPGLTLAAQATTDKRFVLVILRGALDGLAAVQPYGDPALKGMRAALVAPEERLLKLDSFFALHPSLSQLHGLYQAKELEVFHAIATPYRDRSHFDAQNVLETGLDKVNSTAPGWLNRCAARIEGAQPAAMAVGQVLPRVLQGPTNVGSWTPDTLPTSDEGTLRRLQRLYDEDDFLGTRLQQGLRTEVLAGDAETMVARQRQKNLAQLADVAARFLIQEGGPAIAVLEGNGWDTHASQGAAEGQLANRLRELDGVVIALKQGLGEHWKDTQVLVVTEFGRTVHINGSGGTDHGTASVAFRAGGAVDGGKVRAEWPGLASGSLLEGRDLRPTRDLRELYRDAVVHLTGSAQGFDV